MVLVVGVFIWGGQVFCVDSQKAIRLLCWLALGMSCLCNYKPHCPWCLSSQLHAHACVVCVMCLFVVRSGCAMAGVVGGASKRATTPPGV